MGPVDGEVAKSADVWPVDGAVPEDADVGLMDGAVVEGAGMQPVDGTEAEDAGGKETFMDVLFLEHGDSFLRTLQGLAGLAGVT